MTQPIVAQLMELKAEWRQQGCYFTEAQAQRYESLLASRRDQIHDWEADGRVA